MEYINTIEESISCNTDQMELRSRGKSQAIILTLAVLSTKSEEPVMKSDKEPQTPSYVKDFINSIK